MEKWKSEKGVTVIIILLVIIAILGVIMGIKLLTPQEETIIDENNLESYNTLVAEQKKEEQEKERKEILSEIKIANVMYTFFENTYFKIISLAISIAFSIGTAKLYKKLHMSQNIVIFTGVYPIIEALSGFLPGILGTIVMFIASIIAVVAIGNYFKALEMKIIWAVMPLISITMIAFGGALATMGGTPLLMIIGIAGIIAFIVAYIISNIKLGKLFDKGIGFTIGLVILPFIFQPILGYQKEKEIKNSVM